MRKRQAKKVIRASILDVRTYRRTTLHEASRVTWRERNYDWKATRPRERTAGHRFGRWDPEPPTPPWELPF